MKELNVPVRDHLPLKQGLRPTNNSCYKRFILRKVRDHLPLKQGLRQESKDWEELESIVRDHLPLKQGLRPKLRDRSGQNTSPRPSSIKTRIKTRGRAYTFWRLTQVRDHLPLKQGLRQPHEELF